MKVLACDQPWASLIALGVKTVETRPRPHPSTLYGAKIAIHANKKTDFLDFVERPEFAAAFSRFPELPLPLGHIIGTVEVVRSIGICEETVAALQRNKPDEIPFGDYTFGRFAWVLKNPILLKEPIPFRAHQGWPDIDTELIPEYAR